MRIKPNLTERVICAFSPRAANRRVRDRANFCAIMDRGIAYKKGRTDPATYGDGDKTNRDSAAENKRKQGLRNRVEKAIEDSPVLKSVLRDLQTYVAPTGYEPATERRAWNDQITEFLDDWDCKADSRGLKSFFDMLGLAEVEKSRGGDVGFAAVDVPGDARFLSIQPIPGCRIGYPKESDEHSEAYWPTDFPSDNRDHLHYRNGIEFEVTDGRAGRAIKAHVWKLKAPDSGNVFKVPDAAEWEYDTSFDFGSQFWFLTDSLYLSEVRGASDFQQCVNEIESVIRTLKSTSSRLEFFSKLAGYLKGGDGDLGDLPGSNMVDGDVCECGGTGCEKCGPKEIKMGEFLQVWGIPEGKEFEPASFDLEADMLLAVVNALLESAAFSVHLPPSFVNLRAGKTAQGTVERGDQQKAQREFMRRRRTLIKQVARPIVRAALLFGKEQRDPRLRDIPDDEIIKGDFIMPPDISVDPGRDGRQLLNERNAGIIPDAVYHAKFERSPRMMRDAKNRELEDHIEDVRKHSGRPDWNPSPEYVASYLRQTMGMINPDITTGPANKDDENGG